jgi:hypothetical protein
MFLIDDILLAPINGVIAIAEVIDEQVRNETADVTKLKEKLMELQFKFEFDEISEEEFNRKEKELLDMIDAAQKNT